MVARENPTPRFLRAWSGMIVGASAWGVSTQLNYALATMRCEEAMTLVPLIGLALAVVAGIGAFVSATSWRRGHRETNPATLRFIGLVSAALAALFAAAILLHAAAGMIFGCET
jgi:predicted lysophospholipase L1 biosynthesis ABC-type transport system permease subunit